LLNRRGVQGGQLSLVINSCPLHGLFQARRATRHGFGTTLIKAAFPDARIDYAVKGLSCEIEIPLGQNQRDQMEAR
jgi:hypothetical protein